LKAGGIGMNKSRKGNKGFTLVELLIVIVILGIVSFIVSPALVQMRQNYVLKSEVRGLMSAFHTARLEAVKRNADVTISFIMGPYSPAGGVGEYTVFIDEDAVGDPGYRLPDAGEEVLLKKTMPSGVSMPLSAGSNFEGTSPAMWTGFNYRGLPLTGAIPQGVVLQNANSRYVRIIMEPTGTVRLRQNSIDSWL
jgi:type IV fimbrial biogenesis protein FimT